MLTSHSRFRRPALLVGLTLASSSMVPVVHSETASVGATPGTVATEGAAPAVEASLKPEIAAANVNIPPAAPEPVSKPSKSQNVTINLINRLVQKGVLAQEDADELIRQAESDAAEAKAEADAVRSATIQAVQTAQAAAEQAVAGPASEDDIRVTYIPDVVKQEMREQIKNEVMAQARDERWAAPRLVPEWVTKMRITGDVRVRYEGIFQGDGNDNSGAFPNFNAINTGSPFDVSGNTFSPQYNVDQDRKRVRLRARVGAEIDLGNGFTTGLRVATGESNSPVSTNQTLGASGGNFSKYAIWLDRAFVKYELGDDPNKLLAVTVGRFDNPFLSTDIVWDDDIGFDGVAAKLRYQAAKWVTPWVVGGAFPVYNTDFNFSSNRPDKYESTDKWLYAVQAGADLKLDKKISLKLGVGYYDFNDINGRLSDPFVPLSSSDQGNTDSLRPGFAQKGNTYMALRNIIPVAENGYGTTNQWQYFGLATPFRVLTLTGKLDFNYWDPFQVSLYGEYAKNLAFNRSAINAIAVNNRGPSSSGFGSYDGGDTAWIVGLRVGKPAFTQAWDWSVNLNYRRVESDAIVDGFTDSDFGGGGTNVEGWSLQGSIALSPNVSVGARWMTSDQVAGPQLKVDTLQVDLNAKF